MIKVSIAYVKELKKSLKQNSNKLASSSVVSKNMANPSLFRRSMTVNYSNVPKSTSTSSIGLHENETSQSSKIKVVKLPEEDDLALKKDTFRSKEQRRKSWFSSISIIKSLSSHSVSRNQSRSIETQPSTENKEEEFQNYEADALNSDTSLPVNKSNELGSIKDENWLAFLFKF